MSRKVLILANIGNRDVTCAGNFVSPAREKGAELLGRYAEVSADLDLPILLPALRYVGSLEYKYPEVSNEKDLTLRLFCTDQDDPDHRKNDTLELASIAKAKLLEEFSQSQKSVLRFKGQNAIHLNKVSSNPSRYDYMHGFYEDFFEQNRHIRNPDEYLCFVLLSGGTPQMNAMLLLHSVRHFGSNCVQVYVSPGEEAKSLRVGARIARTDARRRFNEALRVRQFRAAAEIAEDAFEGAAGREAACRYAEHRLAFDFKRAREHCDRSLQVGERALEDFLEKHLEEINRLEAEATTGKDKKRLLAELFYNLEVKYRSGEFVDVLGRMFRLQEALLTWIVEGYTGIRTGKRKKLLPDQEDAVDAVPGLMESLTHYKTADGNKLEMGREINRVALMAVTKHLSTPGSGLAPEDQTRAANAATTAANIEKLVNLRNKTVIAHGFEGVSEEDIVRIYDSDSLIEDLRTSVGEALNRDLSTNPFFDLAEKLRF